MRRVWVLLVGTVLGTGLGPGDVPTARAQPPSVTPGTTVARVPSEPIARWPERVARPLRIFVQAAPAHSGWSPEHTRAVHAAFDRWVATGIPIRLAFVAVAADADVTVRTVSRLSAGVSGQTTWQRDAAGWMRRATVVLSRTVRGGPPFTADEIHAVALHEVGHLLGLSHVADPGQIMAPRIRARTLSPGDEASVRTLYGMPASNRSQSLPDVEGR